MESGKLKVAVIGVGNIGSVHTAAISRGAIQGMALGALCDIDPAKRDALAEKYPDVPVYSDAGALIADADRNGIDAVIISTPHRFHSSIAMRALEAGLHVLSEKPADVEYSKAKEACELAKKCGKVYGIMFNQRTDPLFSKARSIIASGEMGAFKRSSWIITNWYRTQAYYDSGDWRATWRGEGGGVMLNQAPHNIDIWIWLLGLPKRLRAFCREGRYHRISVEDEATVYAEFEGGGSGVFVTSTGEAPGLNRLEMAFDRGRIVLENGRLEVLRLGVPEREFCFNSKESFALPPMTEEVFTNSSSRDGHELILEDFASAVLNGTPLLASCEDGVNELAFSNAAFLSSWTDSWVEVPLDPADRATFSILLQKKRDAESASAAMDKIAGRSGAPGGGSDEAYSERWTTRW